MPKLFHLVLNPKAIEYYKDIYDYLVGRAGFRYILVTKHLAHEGQNYDHYHIAVQYENSIKLSAKFLHGAHNEAAEKSIQANIRYCKCEDKKHKALGVTYELIDEKGTMKARGGDYSIKHLREINDPDELPDYRMLNTWKRLKEEEAYDIDDDDLDRKNIKVFYIQGPSGIGKTELAKKILRDNKHIDTKSNKVKFQDGFWHGVGNAKKCLYDDFRSGDMKAKEFVQFIDYNSNIMNVKGGTKINNYNLIIITSVEPLDEIYRNVIGEPREQWVRRITVIDLYNTKNLEKEIEHKVIFN